MCLEEHLIYVAEVERTVLLKEMRETKIAEKEETIAAFTSHFNSASNTILKRNKVKL